MKRLVATVAVVVCAGCGYLDEELVVWGDDYGSEDGATFGIGGMSSYGCGGGYHGYRVRSAMLGSASGLAEGEEVVADDDAVDAARAPVSAPSPAPASEPAKAGALSMPAEVYYEAFAERNDSIAAEYAR